MQVIILYEFIIFLIVRLEVSTDDTQLGVHLTKLLLGRDAEVDALAVLDIVVDGRLERTTVKTILQIRREQGRVLDNEAVQIRVEEGDVSGDEFVEERATETYGELLAVDEVERGVLTHGGVSKVGRGALIPVEATACS